MSTILNALKRLEAERREDENPRALRSMTGEAIGRRRFPLMPVVTATILAGVLGVAVLVWLKGGLPGRLLARKAPAPEPPAAVSPDNSNETPIDVKETARPEAAAAEPGQSAQPTPALASAAPDVLKPPAPVVRQTVPPVYSKELQARTSPQKPSPDRSLNGRRNATKAEAATQPLPRQTFQTDQLRSAPQAAKPPQTAIDRQPPSTPAPSREAESLARGILTLQAISWSDSPSGRLTIIDGRILREGETVDGFTVIQIRPEDIILGKNGKRWRLAYDNR